MLFLEIWGYQGPDQIGYFIRLGDRLELGILGLVVQVFRLDQHQHGQREQRRECGALQRLLGQESHRDGHHVKLELRIGRQ